MPGRAGLKAEREVHSHNRKLVKYSVSQIVKLQQYFLNREESHPEEAYLLEQGFIVMNLAR